MSQMGLRRKIRSVGLFEQLVPPEEIRMRQAVGMVVDPTGHLLPEPVRPYLAPRTFCFFVAGAATNGARGNGRDRVHRAGTLVRLDAHAGTAPSGVHCIVQLRDTTEAVLATVTIPAGQSTGSREGLAVELLSGQWIGVYVLQAGSAADVSIVATQQTG